MSISPPPYRDKDLTSQSWQKWFASIPDALKAMTTAAANTVTTWVSINKAGSKLTDIETRNHDDLQNLNTNTHSHLTYTQYTGLTGGENTTLHNHANQNSGSAGGEFFMLDTDIPDVMDGRPGIDGKNGINGINGINGNDGEDGETGYILLQPINIGGGTGITIDQARAISTLRI